MFYSILKALLEDEKLQFLGVCTPRAVYITDHSELEPWVWSFSNSDSRFFVVEFLDDFPIKGGRVCYKHFITEVSKESLNKYENSEICLRTLLNDSKGKTCYCIDVVDIIIKLEEFEFDTLEDELLPDFGAYLNSDQEINFLNEGGLNEN